MKITGSISQTLKGLNSGVVPIESLIGLPINDLNGNKIGTITYINPENDSWQGAVDHDIFKVENTTSIEIDTAAVKHKEELIEQVKLLGQEVIDRAEDIVGDNDARTSLEIKLSFSQECVPELECNSKYLSKRYFDYFFSDANSIADNIPISVSQSGIPLNAVRENFGFEPIK